jgi:hypothetical protein
MRLIARLVRWLRARHAVAALMRTAPRPLTIRDVRLACVTSAAPRKFNF